MQALKFTKVLKEKVWGGREFESFLGVPLEAGKTFGESWEVSAHPHGPSVVAEGPWAGRTLTDVLTTEGAGLVGRGAWEKYGIQFPLLIKYLDVHDRLSIQVHPGDGHTSEPGKSECWLVLKASPDATLVLGTAPGVTRDEFARRSRSGDWNGLFRKVPVSAGDFVHITPGTVHATLTGSILLCEVQQSSDTTYRIYDFDRLENGKPRELHLDQALEVIRFDEEPKVYRVGTRRRFSAHGAIIEPLVVDPHYTVDRIEVEGTYRPDAGDRFFVWSVLEGEGSLDYEGTSRVRRGDTWLLPAKAKAAWKGTMTLLRTTV